MRSLTVRSLTSRMGWGEHIARALHCHSRPGKHHQAYLDNMNKQIAGSNLESKTLEQVILESWNNGSPTPVFNNAAQVGSNV